MTTLLSKNGLFQELHYGLCAMLLIAFAAKTTGKEERMA
jgi:hypothetical protein